MLYCLIHGHAHNEWERDDVLLIGDELPCIEEDWPVVAGAVVSSTTQAPESEAYFLLSPGQLAYIQSRHAGMVPCKVQRISETHAHVKVTAARVGFPRGVDVILAIPTMTLVSRHQVYVEHKQVRALGPTRFATDDGVLV
jgi:hypothetical protein